jgi:hypothetical protein
MRELVTYLLVTCIPFATTQASAQSQPPAESHLPPQAAYDQAIHPLEVTRRSPQNWSEVELAALNVARDQAEVACAARSPAQFTGDDLLGLARLCAFAQQWQPVLQAASKYIQEQLVTSEGNLKRSAPLALPITTESSELFSSPQRTHSRQTGLSISLSAISLLTGRPHPTKHC